MLGLRACGSAIVFGSAVKPLEAFRDGGVDLGGGAFLALFVGLSEELEGLGLGVLLQHLLLGKRRWK